MTDESPRQPISGSDVFVSYASQDAAVANSMVEALEKAGLRCWIAPRDVVPGSLYADGIVRAINGAKVFVLLLSGHSAASSHVGKEIERASSKRRPIIALHIDKTELTPAFEYFLSESQWIDVEPGSDVAAAERLVKAVRRHIDTPGHTEPPKHAPAGAHPASPPRMKWVVVAGVAVLFTSLSYFVVDNFWLTKRQVAEQSVPSTLTATTEKSIAVLPFVDMSETKDQEYFADGMAEEILDLLAKLPGLRVIGRTSSFQFKGKTDDLRKIGSALGTAYVVEGSVRKAGDRLRITAQLIATRDGSHLWSDTYDDRVGDALKVQDRIATGIVRALQVTVGADDLQAPAQTKNAEAYDLYLRGRHAVERGTKAATESAVGYFQQALELDPSFIRAAEWLARAQFIPAILGWVAPRDGYERARVAVEKGLALNPRSASLHGLRAQILGPYDWDWRTAEQEVERAVKLDPRDKWVLGSVGQVYLGLGRWNEAARVDAVALAIDPLSTTAHWDMAVVRIRMARFGEAEEEFRKALQISPTAAVLHLNLGWTLLYEGRLEEALAEMRQEPTEIRDWGPILVYHRMGRKAESNAALAAYTKAHTDDDPYGIAGAHAYRGEIDQAFSWLERAYRQKQAWLFQIKGNPDFSSLEADPRYKAFLRKLNLPE